MYIYMYLSLFGLALDPGLGASVSAEDSGHAKEIHGLWHGIARCAGLGLKVDHWGNERLSFKWIIKLLTSRFAWVWCILLESAASLVLDQSHNVQPRTLQASGLRYGPSEGMCSYKAPDSTGFCGSFKSSMSTGMGSLGLGWCTTQMTGLGCGCSEGWLLKWFKCLKLRRLTWVDLSQKLLLSWSMLGTQLGFFWELDSIGKCVVQSFQWPCEAAALPGQLLAVDFVIFWKNPLWGSLDFKYC